MSWWDGWYLVAIERASGLVAGAICINRESSEVGGWLAPRFRGCGLGAELFDGCTTFAHRHLGTETVRAGAQTTNAACIGALAAAGFVPTTGPVRHRLPNGSRIPTFWYRHDSDRPSTCQ